MPIQIKHLEVQRIYFDNICLPKNKLLIFKGVVVSSIHFRIEEYAHVIIKSYKAKRHIGSLLIIYIRRVVVELWSTLTPHLWMDTLYRSVTEILRHYNLWKNNALYEPASTSIHNTNSMFERCLLVIYIYCVTGCVTLSWNALRCVAL